MRGRYNYNLPRRIYIYIYFFFPLAHGVSRRGLLKFRARTSLSGCKVLPYGIGELLCVHPTALCQKCMVSHQRWVKLLVLKP